MILISGEGLNADPTAEFRCTWVDWMTAQTKAESDTRGEMATPRKREMWTANCIISQATDKVRPTGLAMAFKCSVGLLSELSSLVKVSLVDVCDGEEWASDCDGSKLS